MSSFTLTDYYQNTTYDATGIGGYSESTSDASDSIAQLSVESPELKNSKYNSRYRQPSTSNTTTSNYYSRYSLYSRYPLGAQQTYVDVDKNESGGITRIYWNPSLESNYNLTASYQNTHYQEMINRGKLPWRNSIFTGNNSDELDDGISESSSHGIYNDTHNRAQSTRTAILHGLGIYEGTSYKMLVRNIENYNRYKLPMPDMSLQRSFAHVFFIKPQCNILDGVQTSDSMTMVSELYQNEDFLYACQHAPYLLYEISAGNNPLSGSYDSDFSLLLSNAVTSFSTSDESMETDAYGKSLTGYQIAYGKHDAASKTAGEMTITFQDDKELHIYQLIKLWTSYIIGCYQGTINPTLSNLQNHILDYAGGIYYILTAEDGETILFWSKYYGVFPVNSPSSMFGWSYGNLLSNPKYDITFKYSYKEDYNMMSLYEFNINSGIRNRPKPFYYSPTYDYNTMGPGRIWTGPPFIETTRNQYGFLTYKLRFTPARPVGDWDYRNVQAETDLWGDGGDESEDSTYYEVDAVSGAS